MDRIPLAGKIAIAVFALAAAVAVIVVVVLVSNDTIGENWGLGLFSVFAILGGIGFITDAFKREGAPKAFLAVVFKFASLGLTLGLIAGDWGEYWWQLTIGGLLVGIVVALVEGRIRTGDAPPRVFRLVVWNLVGVAAIGEGVYKLTTLL
ncbi:MAG: hypothetical protein OXC99_02095 [Chloroflexi bacterium]|nr:hypothetical protein [Chloroflexota bacterium]